MFSPENFSSLFREVMAQLGGQSDEKNISRQGNGNNQGSQNSQSSQGSQSSTSKIAISPSQALVIAGILGGVLEVDSILVDRQQRVEILLLGSLRQKNQLEKMFDQVGTLSFDQVLNAMLGRLK